MHPRDELEPSKILKGIQLNTFNEFAKGRRDVELSINANQNLEIHVKQ